MFAAKLLEHAVAIGRTDVEVESAGYLKSAAKGEAAAAPWNELKGVTGVDLSTHRSRWIGNLDLSQFSSIVCLDDHALKGMVESGLTSPKVPIYLIGILNPWQKGVDAYRECYREVCRLALSAPLPR